MNLALLPEVVRTIFFLLSVSARLKKTITIICGGIGSTWGRNFYMGTQNGSKLDF